MSEFLRPDVYIQEVASGEKPIASASTSIGAFVGVTPRGESDAPVYVTSWTDFINKFANGLSTPFLRTSDLPNAVYGFFQNGGTKCYISRVVSKTCAEAKGTLQASLLANEEESSPKTRSTKSVGLEIKAKDKGDWANGVLTVTVVANDNSLFDVVVSMNGVAVETLSGLSNNINDADYFVPAINESSAFIKVDENPQGVLVAGEVTLTGGVTGSVVNSDFTDALDRLDRSEINLLAMPGKSEQELLNALVSYADKRNDCFAILDAPKGKTASAIVDLRKQISGTNGAFFYPNAKIVDPLGRTKQSLKVCSPSGHVMGMIARTDSDRGVYKAPAGEEATLVGLVDLEVKLSVGELDLLNPVGVNALVVRPSGAIVSWGARTLSALPDKRYISDVRYDMMIRKSLKEGTQWAIFEPNDEKLWNRLATSITSFLETEYQSGALRGSSSEEAYYVKCDSELNTESSINQGLLIAEVGYAKQKPAEFVVVRLVQKSNN